MVRTSTTLLGLMTIATAGLVSSAFAGGDVEEGRAKSVQCVACHGPGGVTPNSMFPNLAGQNASYLEMQLTHFKTGERYHPVMSPIAESLSRDDIEDLAAYFSSIGPLADEP